MRRFPLLLALLLLVLPAAAQTWHPIGPDGGRFQRLLLDRNAPGRLFAAGARIWMSDDGGASWRRLVLPETDGPLVDAVSDPRDRNVLWLATPYGVYRSGDGGRSFTEAYFDGQRFTSIDLEGTILYVGSETGLVEYDGKAWFRWPTWTKEVTLYVSPGATYLTSANELWVTTSPATGWTMTASLAGGRVVAVDGDRVWRLFDTTTTFMRSDDRGAHWTAATLPEHATQFAADTASHRLYAATAGGLLASDDRAATWHPVAGAPAGSWTAVSVDGPRIAGNAADRVVASIDSGASWSNADRGLIDGRVSSLAVDPSTPGLLVAGVNGRVLRHDASGWGPSFHEDGVDVALVAFDPSTPRRAVASGNGELSTYLYESRDGGVTWSRGATIGRSFNDAQHLDFDPWRPLSIYVCDGSGYITRMSDDGGLMWHPFEAGTDLVNEIVATPAALYAATVLGLMRSADRGTTWTATAPTPASAGCGDDARSQHDVLAAAVNGAAIVIINNDCLGRHLYASADDGATWHAPRLGPRRLTLDAVIADPAHAGRFFAADDRTVYRSDDAGETWHVTGHGFPRNSGWIITIALDAATNSLYAATDETGVWTLDLDAEN